MRRSIVILALACAAGIWIFQGRLPTETVRRFLRTNLTEAASHTPLAPSPVERQGGVLRMASFNIQVFGERKASKPHVMQVLADVVRRFDIVAIQEIRSSNQQLLPAFVDLVNSAGRRYDYVLGPRQGRTSSKEQYAFVFDAASVEVDRATCYVVDDPDDLMHRPPFVASFRVRGVPPEQAFTFTLVNVHTDPDEVDTEVDVLADVYRAVRQAAWGEDDILLVGDLNVDDRHLGRLGAVPGIRWIVSGVPTNTLGTKQYDNILFHEMSTTEFTGRTAGVFDLMSEYQLTMDQALEVSDHRPVWSEFSVHENGARGRVAAVPDERHSQ